MADFFGSLSKVIHTSIILAVLLFLFLSFGSGGFAIDQLFWSWLFRYFHVVAGIMWIGLLYYFNFVQVPNMSSPWGAQHQFGDLTHKTAYTPGSMRQMAITAGLKSIACYPQIGGSRSRIILGSILHAVLSKALSEPPEIWSGNFITILEREKV